MKVTIEIKDSNFKEFYKSMLSLDRFLTYEVCLRYVVKRVLEHISFEPKHDYSVKCNCEPFGIEVSERIIWGD